MKKLLLNFKIFKKECFHFLVEMRSLRSSIHKTKII